jgi:hypothetical protein
MNLTMKAKNYEGKNFPFQTFLEINQKQDGWPSSNSVDSALYDNDLNGHVFLDSPPSRRTFEDMKFTSTAEIAGARIVLSTPSRWITGVLIWFKIPTNPPAGVCV